MSKAASGEQKLALKIPRSSGKVEDWTTWKMNCKAVLELGGLLENLETLRPEAGRRGHSVN